MGRLEYGDVIGDVGPGGDAHAADLGGHGIREIVPVQVRSGQHVELRRPQQHELEDDVGDAILDDDLALGAFAVVLAPQLLFGDGFLTELLAAELVAPVAKGSLGELHDVALVHQGHALAAFIDGVANGFTHQAPCAEGAYGFDADAGVVEKLGAHLLFEELFHLAHLGAAGFVLDTGVHVLGVFPEDDHIDELRVAQRRRHARVVANRTHTGVKIELLAERHVERAETATHGSRQRSLDGDRELVQCIQGLLRKIVAVVNSRGLLAHEQLAPVDLAFAAVSFGDRRIPDTQTCSGDVRSNSVSFDSTENGIVRDHQFIVGDADQVPPLGDLDMLIIHDGSF